jgi:hypothetical protein
MPLPPPTDVDFMLEDTGVLVSSGVVSGKGLLEQPQRLIQDGYVITTEWTLLARADQFGGLLYGDALTADGINFLVREARILVDGVLCEISLEKLAPDTAAPGRHPTNSFGLADLADVDLSDPDVGDLLVNNGTNWVNVNEVDGGGP